MQFLSTQLIFLRAVIGWIVTTWPFLRSYVCSFDLVSSSGELRLSPIRPYGVVAIVSMFPICVSELSYSSSPRDSKRTDGRKPSSERRAARPIAVTSQRARPGLYPSARPSVGTESVRRSLLACFFWTDRPTERPSDGALPPSSFLAPLKIMSSLLASCSIVARPAMIGVRPSASGRSLSSIQGARRRQQLFARPQSLRPSVRPSVGSPPSPQLLTPLAAARAFLVRRPPALSSSI